MATIIPFGGRRPVIHPSAFVAPTAVLIGDVTVGEASSIWFGAVLRGDDPDHGIVVGARTSVQDNCVVHVGRWGPTVIGADVTVGHGAKFESCTIGDRTVVGMNAVILQKAVVGEECLLAANTVVIYTSDHGYNLGHHGIWHKGNGRWILTDNRGDRPNLWDNSLRTPTIIRWPGHIHPA